MADRIRSDAGAASRRRFIQQAGAGSAAVAAATLGLATQEAEAAQAFDASYDVVVCGSGCGGLASALFARWQGNSAVILGEGRQHRRHHRQGRLLVLGAEQRGR